MTSDSIDSKVWLREIGAMLRDTRKRQRLTQEQVANSAGVYRSFISRIESGEYDLKVSTLYKLCKALGVSVTLIGDDDLTTLS